MHDQSKESQEIIEENILLKQRIQKLENLLFSYKMLLASATEGILVAELQTRRFIYANPALCNMFRCTEEEILQLGVDDIHPKEYLERVLAEFYALARGEKPYVLNIPCLRKDGSFFYANISVASIVLDGAKCNVGFFTDITGHKLAEEALRQSEERLSLCMEATNDGVWDWDIKTDKGYFSPGYYRMLGYELGAFPAEGKVWKDLIHPDDIEHVLRVNMDCIEGRSENFEVEYRMRTRNGEWLWILGRGKCVARNESGYALRLVGTHVDITERKRAEEALYESETKYRRLHESMREAFVIVDMNGRIQESNHAYQSMLGYSEEELSHLTYSDITPEKWHAFEKSIVEEQILEHGYSEVYEKEYQRKDGLVIPVELRTVLVCDNAGNPAGMWAIVRDITDRKR
ncbi:MAG: PAS domain S-box protein, partial [Smithella sp.]